MSKGRHEDLAVGACYAELEARRLKGCDNIPSGANEVKLTGASLLCTLPADLPNATGTLRVRRVALAGFKPSFTYVETSTDTGRLRLDMTVTWQGVKNDKGSVTVSSLVLR
jgi:hypothetical protein